MSVGAGVLASLVVQTLLSASISEVLSPILLWAGIIVPIVLAFGRGRPRGLLSFRATDILYGVVLGLILRTVQGWFAVAAGGSGALPSYPSLNSQLSPTVALTAILLPVVVAPLVEELLFRGVVLVSVFRIARRGVEGALLAAVASVASFVAMHAIDGVARWDEPVALALVAMTCSALVLLTGRIWAAVLVHLVFNGSYVVLALIGTFVG
ncbi:CPBP family glutamic-type intramembrane protease [Microbacterium oryzae]|uniref:CPBP family intramembrane glutamic endopeptidase n=1 Tax=Microbacterium oryzae TaxID=743009 RepID=UPI0025B229EE|nr:CPBP family intramembrane glutamic endopeptidase [Microbacterium oryzae]MDN3311621.1 CPBP family glutamic-type intramembrane protease [Microbacterium oryzae]